MTRGLLALALALVVGLAGPLAAQTEWPSEGPPRPLAARTVAFPPYELRTLPNGLQVVAVLHHEQPVVSMRMIVRAGASLDPRNKAGLADLAASLLDQGTTTMTASEMNDAVDFIGAGMGAGAGTDLTFANIVVMKDSFEFGLKMLSDMVRHPAFRLEEIERRRRQTLSALQVSFEDPEFVADAVFDRLVFGDHPYGLPRSGTPDTLAAISRDDLVAYHAQYFVPNNTILAVVGDVTAEEAFAAVGRIFSDWARKDIARPVFPASPDPTRRVIVVNKPDAVQTEVRVGHLGVRRAIDDYMALNLTVRILGGEGANRLHQVLRTERGLTYGAKADLVTLLESGDFEASTNTRTEATGEALRLMVDEFWRLQRERVGERELSSAKAYITGSFPLTIETPDAIATQVLNVLFFGLPVEQLQSYRDRVNAVRPEDIERAARTYLRPDRLSVVLVGNAPAFVSQLAGLGFQHYEVVNMSDLDLMAVDFKRRGGPPTPGGAPPGRASGGRPQYLRTDATSPGSAFGGSQAGADSRVRIAELIAAKGGLERLRAIRTITAATRATGRGPTQTHGTLETVTYLEYPNRLRVESKSERGDMVQVYDGSHAWVRDPGGVREVPERMIRDLEAGLKRDTIAALLAADAGQLRARILPDARDESGRRLQVIELSATDLDPVLLYVDPDSHLIAKQSYVAGGPGRSLVEEIFSDYRPVDGVQVAFSTLVRIHGEPVLERTVTRFTINGPVSPTTFKRPVS
jgi:zinc protease